MRTLFSDSATHLHLDPLIPAQKRGREDPDQEWKPGNNVQYTNAYTNHSHSNSQTVYPPNTQSSPQFSHSSHETDSPIFAPPVPGFTPLTYEYGYPIASQSSGSLDEPWQPANLNNPEVFDTPPPDSGYSGSMSYQTSSSSADANALYAPSSSQGYGYSTQFELPSSTSFEASGLPFLGLTALQNWPGSAPFLEDGKETAWRSFDRGAFTADPELPLPFSNHSNHNGYASGSKP